MAFHEIKVFSSDGQKSVKAVTDEVQAKAQAHLEKWEGNLVHPLVGLRVVNTTTNLVIIEGYTAFTLTMVIEFIEDLGEDEDE